MQSILERKFSDNFSIRLLQAASPRFAAIFRLLMFAVYAILAGLGSTKLDHSTIGAI